MTNPFRRFVLAACLVCYSIPMASAAVIYQQNWDTPNVTGGVGDPLSTYNWSAHEGENGNDSSNWPSNAVSAASNSQARVVDDAAAPSPSDRLFTFWFDGDGVPDLLFWTEDFTAVNPADYTELTINWLQRHDGTNGARAAVAVDTGSGTQWYAGALNPQAGGGWVGESANLLGSEWIAFSFDGTQNGDATSGFDVSGAAGTLPAGDIVAAGVYVELANGTSGRMDSFTINGTFIPEPTSLALLGLGGLCMLSSRRRST